MSLRLESLPLVTTDGNAETKLARSLPPESRHKNIYSESSPENISISYTSYREIKILNIVGESVAM